MKKEREILNLIKKLVEIPSTSDNLSEIERCFEVIQKSFGSFFITKKYSFRKRPILILSNTKEKNSDLILAGHLDVVSGPQDIFNFSEKNLNLYGRGVFDMKGPLATSVFAVKQYLEESNDPIKIAIIITGDEELDGLSTKYLVDKIGYKAKFAILPDGGEETKIVTSQKGFLQLEVAIQGKSAHASRPWEGENPIEKGFFLYQKLLKEFPTPANKNQWKTSLVLTKIESGKDLNQIPKQSKFYFDIRYTQKIDPKRIFALIKKELKKNYDLNIIAQNDMLMSDRKNPYLEKLTQSIEKIQGVKALLSQECSTSDAVFFSQKGTPAVLFSPRGGGAHHDQEWVNKKSLLRFHDVLVNFFENFKK